MTLSPSCASCAPDMLKAGNETDALVAEKVMGFWYADTQWWGPHPSMPGERAYASVCTSNRLFGANYRDSDGLPFFSTDLAAAWEVVEKLRKRGLLVELTMGIGVYCRITGKPRQFAESREDTAPLAICLAALKAVDAHSASSFGLERE